MKVLGISDVGAVRQNNEDNFTYGVEARGSWAVVCDGVGGTSGGEVASKIITRYMERTFKDKLTKKHSSKTIMNMVEIGISSGVIQIMDEAQKDPYLANMATTVVGAVLQEEEGLLFWVGDSRAYCLRGDQLTQLTKDHSVVQQMVDDGEITPEEAEVHPMRNLITNSINTREAPFLEYDFVDLEDGDWILLCSDGVNDYIPAKDLPGVVATAVVLQDPKYIVERAIAGGGGDNITAVLMAYERR